MAVLFSTEHSEYSFTSLSITFRDGILLSRRVYTSMFHRLSIDLAITLRETLFSPLSQQFTVAIRKFMGITLDHSFAKALKLT